MIEAAASWKDLESKLRPFLSRRVPPADVDDVMQDVFVRMQRGVGSLRDEERFGPWVYRVARSAVVDHLRTRARNPIADPDSVPDAIVEVEDDDAESMLAAYVAVFVAALPEPYRQALTLTELEGMTQKDAAEMLGISLTAMKSRVRRGRAQLRRSLEACCRIALDARGRVIECTPRGSNCCP